MPGVPAADGTRRRSVRVSRVLVGRQDLLDHLDRRLTSSAEGAGHLVLLAGEAGIGKTRLLEETTRRAAELGLQTYAANTFARDLEVVGGTLLDLARTLGESSVPDTRASGGRLLASVTSPDAGIGDASRAHRLRVDELADSVVSVMAGSTPALVTLEDLHWTDDLTLEVLERIARRLPSRSGMLIGTYRTDELYPRVPMRRWRSRLITQRLAEEIRVPRLSPADTAELAAQLLGERLSAAATTGLHARSDGIPLHIEELLPRTADGDAGDAPVPDTLADAVLVRVAGLSEAARDVLAAASVLGRSFEIDLLAAVSDQSPEEADEALRELAEHQLTLPRGDGRTYDFRHALIRDAVYDDLPPHRRRALHARAAAAAVAAGLGDAFVSDQYERAHEPAAACEYALRAAAAASRLSAHREAVALYWRAQRTTGSSASDSERAALLAALAAELAATDDNQAAADAYQAAYELRVRDGDPAGAAALAPAWVACRHLLGDGLQDRVALLEAALALVPGGANEQVAARGRLEAALAAAYMLDRRLDDALRHGEAAEQLLERSVDLAALRDVDASVGSTLVFAGQMDEGWQRLHAAVVDSVADRQEAQAARAYRMIGSSASVLVEYDLASEQLDEGIGYAELTERWNDRHYMGAHRAHVHWAVGEWDAAQALAEAALADGEGGITTRITALHVLGYVAMGRGHAEVATERLSEALAVASGMGELQRVSPAMWGLAENALLAGLTEESLSWCERGFEASAAIEDAAYLFPYVVTGTRAAVAASDLTAARQWLARAEPLIRLRRIPGTLACLDHAHGLLLLAENRPGRARPLLLDATTAWRGRRRYWEGSWAALDAARAARRSKQGAQAGQLIEQVRISALACGADTLLRAVEAAGGSSGPATASAYTPLSSREFEVARLVADGLTNKEIAAQLYLSPRTIATHMEHVLAKLGATRRSEVAAWATTRLGELEPDQP